MNCKNFIEETSSPKINGIAIILEVSSRQSKGDEDIISTNLSNLPELSLSNLISISLFHLAISDNLTKSAILDDLILVIA